MIAGLLKGQIGNCYSDTKFTVIRPTKLSKGDGDELEQSTKGRADFENPEQDLFIWAVLSNRREMAYLFWQLGKNPLSSSLIASALLKALSKVADTKEELELRADLTDHAALFEERGIKVLSECYRRNKTMSHQLLVRELPSWGCLTLFSIANAHNMMDFMEHASCQTKLSLIWKGKMALCTTRFNIVLCIFFPIFILFIKFTSKCPSKGAMGRSTGASNKVGPNGVDKEFASSGSARRKTLSKTKLFDCIHNTINSWSYVLYFYSAPITKFIVNMVFYFVFLAIFSYFVLVDLRPVEEPNSPSFWEYITWIWVATMVIEELRQLKTQYKISNWFSNMWNRYDLSMYSMLIICIILRCSLNTTTFIWCRRMYSLTLIVFYMRAMQFFLAEKNMGPKVIMIKKMLTDLWSFFFILLLFVLSFGVAYHVNIFPNSPVSWGILKNVLLMPYLQIYGELFLEKIEGEDSPSCTRNQTIWQEVPDMRCPEENDLSTVLLAVYMLLTNILLVNLLIAMFSCTFNTVQENSMKVWHFYRFSLVHEYYDRPTLVPPIIIINHMLRILRLLIFKTCKTCKKANAFKEVHIERDNDRLNSFENNMAAKCYLAKSSASGETAVLRQSVDDLSEQSSQQTLSQIMHILEILVKQKEGVHTSPEQHHIDEATKDDYDV
ncbi:transient receptor potential cation channel subfamily M member-like 2 isoform X1 [Gigantopelta aegis]|uniref:transient receptor potential cation channel subfamily M member-like 2 isoform X1 n=1 Tax=Gigantopelta aegis TaxID=1735272 RepID=UPI001B88BD01|nr:transient receptor potential cation channel subfamily M member-like 2 isoform X1 [Gigantopelta aegis]